MSFETVFICLQNVKIKSTSLLVSLISGVLKSVGIAKKSNGYSYCIDFSYTSPCDISGISDK